MNKNLKRIAKYLLFFALLSFLVTMPVYAASGKVDLCSYPGTLRAFKIVGIVLKIVAIVVPILLIGVTIVGVSKTILSGDSNDIIQHISTFVKRFVAAVLIFFVPMIFDFIFNNLVSSDTSSYKACTVCLFNTGNCRIPKETTTE